MLDEKKGTCCHKCGHVHVKGTPCPEPPLTGKRSCAKRLKEDIAADETDQYCRQCLADYIEEHWNMLEEAEYRGRKVQLGKPFLTPDGPKKRSVYVKNKKGNVIKVNFGDPNLKIKKSNPKRRKSFRARHKCHTAKDRTTPRYWSCKFW